MRLRFLAVLLALTMAAGVGAQPNAPQPVKKDKPKATAVKKGVRPAWAELTAEQQATLAPLKNDWDTLEPERRQKWIQIAKRYPRMKPLEQERVQRRMQAWAEYQALPPQERESLVPSSSSASRRPKHAN